MSILYFILKRARTTLVERSAGSDLETQGQRSRAVKRQRVVILVNRSSFIALTIVSTLLMPMLTPWIRKEACPFSIRRRASASK